MLRIKLSGVLLLALLILAAAGCGGSGGPDPNPNPDFTRLTAQVLSASGDPLAGLNIRVEGQDTGLVTNASGGFSLPANAFPNGVDSQNELSFGKGGFVVGSREIVPSSSENLTITFGESDPGNTAENGRVTGSVTSANTGQGLDGVQVTLFSVDGGVFQTSSTGGTYSINDVPAGNWQMAAYLDGYTPAMAFVEIAAGETTDFDLALKQDGVVAPGDGLKVKGILKDSATGQPIAGAFLSLSADTGYYGIMDGRELPVPGTDAANGGTVDGGVGTGVVEPSTGVDGRESSMSMPIWYDPQYQETTTASDGTFEFPNEVVGYSIFVNLSAEGYLVGNYYQDIFGQNGTLELDLELTPIEPADISGVVRDGEGNPVEGALVEFIFSGGFGGGPKPLDDIAVPPMANFEDFAADGTATRENVGAPVPAPDFGNDAAAPGQGPATGGAGGGSSELDNLLMQRFRHEHQNDGRNASDLGSFDGYLSYVTGPDGKYEFTEVPAGSYWVIASAYRHESSEQEYEAAASPAENNLDIVLEEIPVGTIEGDIVDEETGLPIEDVLVNAVLPTIDPFDYTDANGHFVIENVPVADGWIVGAYKAGYLTSTETVNVTENGTVTVQLSLQKYEAPAQDMVDIFGTIYDSSDPGTWDEIGNFTGGSGVGGADIVFTPLANELGSFYRHVVSAGDGKYNTDLVNGADYNLLIQCEGFQDLFTRVWPNAEWRQMDFWLAPIAGTPGQGGGNSGGGGTVIDPGVPVGGPDDPSTPPDGDDAIGL
ncbi:carboxypeptidase regulatory-like domain-containing protein [bacterium]|nr:carboxypeptidase regulatory-like domain-containing protein [bacterium]